MPQSDPMGRSTCVVGSRMARSKSARADKAMGFLSRLRRDVRGNTLAIVAAAMIPLIAMVGGGIDVSRMYLAKVRLQHACDAGALAGRKAMGAGTWAQTSPNPNTIAQQFFDGNFRSGAYGTNSLSRTYSENSGDVSGTASVAVPMTMMKFFGMPSRTMTVVCDAQMQLPNTDVMFVLDNTGSMACDPNGNNCNSGSSSKIYGLREAVKCFFESVAQLKTNASTCTNSTSNAGVNSSSQIRFGFVPYTTNVSVGKLLDPSWFANSWQYQTRTVNTINYAWSGVWQDTNIACSAMPASDPSPSSSTSMQYQAIKSNGSVTTNMSKCVTVQSQGTVVSSVKWNYGYLTQDVSGLKNNGAWNSSYSTSFPINNDGSAKTLTWDGCIEERQTQQTSSTPTFTINSSDQIVAPNGQVMKDLDIDAVPSQADSTTLWAPAFPGLIYTRNATTNSTSNWTTSASTSTTNYVNVSSYSCPAAAQKLTTWSGAAAFDSYVDGLTAGGNTYHDIGMLWGGRLMSPTGLFASENALSQAGGQIQRHLIFMTDGDTQTSDTNYTAYGVGWFDHRETPSNNTPGNTDLDSPTNARFAALCTAVKNKGITVWVISFGGTGIAASTKTRLQNCATDTNHYFDATSSSSLNSAFQLIAAQITQLRLTK